MVVVVVVVLVVAGLLPVAATPDAFAELLPLADAPLVGVPSVGY